MNFPENNNNDETKCEELDTTLHCVDDETQQLHKVARRTSSRKERRDRKKKKKSIDAGTTDSPIEVKHEENVSNNNEQQHHQQPQQQQQIISKMERKKKELKPRSRLTDSFNRAFASNPSIQIRPRSSYFLSSAGSRKSSNDSSNDDHQNIQNNEKTSDINNNNADDHQKKEEEDDDDEENDESELGILKKDVLRAMQDSDLTNFTKLVDQLKDLLPDGNINFRYKDGFTLIHKAIQQVNSVAIIKVLIEKGSIIQMPSLMGLSPLHFAAQIGNFPTFEFLLNNNANPMQRDVENRACLHFAVMGGNLNCVELLLKQSGVLINHRDNSGISALHLAVKSENKEIVELLLNKGADPLLMDNQMNRPIDLLPGYSRILSPKNIKLSAQGKKVLKLLKKRGGHRLPVTNSFKSEVMGSSILRSRSLDHRNPVISAELTRNLANKGIKLNSASASNSPTNSNSNLFDNNNNNNSIHLNQPKKVEIKEEDLELLYYNPNNNNNTRKEEPQSASNSNNNNNNISTKKTDKYGFYTSSNTETNAVKQSKIQKEEKMALKWLELIKSWDPKNKKIQKYCDKGIPDSVRGIVWKMLTGSNEVANSSEVVYEELLTRDSIPIVKNQILKDINRTMPNHVLFQEKGQGQQMLTNVLTAYSVYKPTVGYCQGMGFITAMFLMYMPEEDAFWMLERIAEEYRFAELWDEKMTLVSKCTYATEMLMKHYLPEIHAKFEEDCIPHMYVPQFFITGYLYSLPFSMVVRIWDSFLLRKFDYLYAVALSLFKVSKDKILKMKMEQVILYLKFKENGEELDFTVDQLLKTATNLWSKLSPSHIRKLEEEGLRIKEARNRQ